MSKHVQDDLRDLPDRRVTRFGTFRPWATCSAYRGTTPGTKKELGLFLLKKPRTQYSRPTRSAGYSFWDGSCLYDRQRLSRSDTRGKHEFGFFLLKKDNEYTDGPAACTTASAEYCATTRSMRTHKQTLMISKQILDAEG